MSVNELEKMLSNAKGKIMFVGVGSEIRGDEVGVKRIIEKITQADISEVAAIWTDTRPENCLKNIESYNPREVVFLLASKFGGEPGEIRVLDITDSEDSLHESPLTTLSHYLNTQVGTKSRLVVVEPKYLKIVGVSDEMVNASNRIGDQIISTLKKHR